MSKLTDAIENAPQIGEDMLEAFGIGELMDAWYASKFNKCFDGKTLFFEISAEDPDSNWAIIVNGFEIVGSVASRRMTEMKFDAWMNRLEGKQVEVSENVIDKWEKRMVL